MLSDLGVSVNYTGHAYPSLFCLPKSPLITTANKSESYVSPSYTVLFGAQQRHEPAHEDSTSPLNVFVIQLVVSLTMPLHWSAATEFKHLSIIIMLFHVHSCM